MDKETAQELAKKVKATGNKGFLFVVFPEGKNANDFEMSDIDIATNANNDVLLEVVSLVGFMICTGNYRQRVFDTEQKFLPET